MTRILPSLPVGFCVRATSCGLAMAMTVSLTNVGTVAPTARSVSPFCINTRRVVGFSNMVYLKFGLNHQGHQAHQEAPGGLGGLGGSSSFFSKAGIPASTRSAAPSFSRCLHHPPD